MWNPDCREGMLMADVTRFNATDQMSGLAKATGDLDKLWHLFCFCNVLSIAW